MPLDRRPIEQMVSDVGPEAFQRLARLFDSETRAAIGEMRRLLDRRDWGELGRQAHSLKNSTASFGLPKLAATAQSLEQAADSSQSEAARSDVAALEAALVEDLAALGRFLVELGA
jgi:HPt (histidine-containing phosphotransfer) domain-containing protein